jgi:hypothetical protein
VLLAEADTEQNGIPEQIVAESTAYCRESGRLTWIVLDWLIHHVDQLDEQTLLESTAKRGELPVLGVLSDAASQRRPHPKLKWVMQHCAPNLTLEPFFRRVARSPLATCLTRENALDLFLRWNFLCSELRYLEDELSPRGTFSKASSGDNQV